MKRFSTKLLLVLLVMILMMTASVTMVSAAQTSDYSGTTQEQGLQALRSAMAVVENGTDYVLTLKNNIVITPDVGTRYDIGTEKTSAATLTVQSELNADGTPKYGITVGEKAVLNFMGNVTFKNVILARQVTASDVSYYSGSYIFVTEGKGTFGDKTDTTKYGNVANPDSSNRKALVSLAGPNLEIYSGKYMAIGANFRSEMDVENPTIVFGGNAEAELVVGRGLYTYKTSRVIGTSNLTVTGGKITKLLTGGYFKPMNNLEAELGGDANLTVSGGTINLVNYVGNSRGGGVDADYIKTDGKKSVYKVTFTGGTVNGVSSVYTVDGPFDVKNLDITVDFKGTKFTNYVYTGIEFYGTGSAVDFCDSTVMVNMNGQTFTSGFFGGSFFNPSENNTGTEYTENVTRTFNITNTTFGNLVCFGSRMATKASDGGIVKSNHKGTTTITVTATTAAEKVSFANTGTFYLGSYLDGQQAKHTGDITFKAENVKASTFVLAGQSSTRFMGSYCRKSNTEHSANVNVTMFAVDNANKVSVWASSQSIALCNVLANLNGVKIGGQSTIALKNFYIGSNLFGGSVLSSPVTNTGSTKLIINEGTYPYSNQKVQFFGGDQIVHSGKNNDSTASSEIVINSYRSDSNDYLIFYGGSRFSAAGTSYINSKATVAKIEIARTVYGGSDMCVANAMFAGTSKVELKGGWAKITAPEIFAGSRMGAENTQQTGSSEFIVSADGPSTSTIFYGGSNLCSNGSKHTGTSQITILNGAFLRQYSYGGSKISASNCLQTGNSAIMVTNGTMQNYGNYYFGGSYLNNATAKHDAESKIQYTAGELGNTVGGAFGGSNIVANGAVQTGKASFIVNGGTISGPHGAGSYTTQTITDNDTSDIIPTGFCQLADVYYTVTGGEIAAAASCAGYNANVKGSVYVTVSGGTLSESIFSLSNSSANAISVQKDAVIKISGGTLKSNIVNGGSNNSSTKTEGTNVALGRYYMEFINDGKGAEIVVSPATEGATSIMLEPVGRNQINSDMADRSTCVKFIGDVPMYDANGKSLFEWNFNSSIGKTGERIFDLTQHTSGRAIASGSFNKRFEPITNNALSVTGFDPSTAKLADLVSFKLETLTWSGKTYNYSDLVKYDDLTSVQNKFGFVDADTRADFTPSTRKIALTFGNTTHGTYTIPNLFSDITNNYAVTGSSIRTQDLRIESKLALRCRAKISKSWFDNSGKSVTVNGFKLYKLGILVSASESGVLTPNAGTTDAVAWENGKVNSNGWRDEGDGYYYFAAAITGYNEENGSIISNRAKAPVYFRAYMDIEVNGNIKRIYLDNPRAADTSNNATNYSRSLDEVAKLIWANERSWVDESETRFNTLKDIFAATSANYSITIGQGAQLCGVESIPMGTTGTTTNFIITFKPAMGYKLKKVTLDGQTYNRVPDMKGNVLELAVGGNRVFNVTFERKESAELTARRNEVVAAMEEIVGTYFRYDKDYTYTRNGTTRTLKAGQLYRGMPYSETASNSFEGYLTFGNAVKGADGVYTLSFANSGFGKGSNIKFGNSCANAVFWSWAKVSPGVTFTWSANMVESKGVVPVGIFTYNKDSVNNNNLWTNTKGICDSNGIQVMSEAYALMMPGDAIHYYNGSNHAILVKSVNVVRNADGTINTEKSYIMFHEQHGGLVNGKNDKNETFYSTCSLNEKKTFASMFETGYIPVTVNELLGDTSDGIALVNNFVANDSLSGKTLDQSHITAGSIYNNYPISHVKLEIKDKSTGAVVYSAYRYMRENVPTRFDFSTFETNDVVESTSNTTTGVYNDKFTKSVLTNGKTYVCTATAYSSVGSESTLVPNVNSKVVRTFEFTYDSSK